MTLTKSSETVLNTVELLDIILEHHIGTSRFIGYDSIANVRLVNKLWCQRASRLYFKTCSITELNQLSYFKEKTGNDYSSFVRSIFIHREKQWEPYVSLDLGNVVHLYISVEMYNEIPRLLLIHQSCPAINAISVHGEAGVLVDFLQLSIDLFPNALLSLDIRIEENGTYLPDLEAFSKLLSKARVTLESIDFGEVSSTTGCVSIMKFLDTVACDPSLVSGIHELTLGYDTYLTCELRNWKHLGELCSPLKVLDLSVDGHFLGDGENMYSAARCLLRLVECASRVEELYIQIRRATLPDDWIEKLTDCVPSLSFLDLTVTSDQPAFGKNLFRSLKKWKRLRYVDIVNYAHIVSHTDTSTAMGLPTHGLEVCPFDKNDHEVWFPCLTSLYIGSEVGKREFRELVSHHMPRLSNLSITHPRPPTLQELALPG